MTKKKAKRKSGRYYRREFSTIQYLFENQARNGHNQ